MMKKKALTITGLISAIILITTLNNLLPSNTPIKKVIYLTSPQVVKLPIPSKSSGLNLSDVALLDQNSVDHIQRNIDKSTIRSTTQTANLATVQVKYLKRGTYTLIDTKSEKPIQIIQVGPSENNHTPIENCDLAYNQVSWRQETDLPKLQSCVQAWLYQQTFSSAEQSVSKLYDFLKEKKIDNQEELSNKWQCQETLYLFSDHITKYLPKKDIIKLTLGENICGNDQYILRGLYTTAAHDTNGKSEDFEELFQQCVTLSSENLPYVTSIKNCKSAIVRSIMHYYYLTPTIAIEICQNIPSFQKTNESNECGLIIYNEYIAELRYLNSKDIQNPITLADKDSMNKIRPELICEQNNHPGCWEASAVFIQNQYEKSIPLYLKTCQTSNTSNQTPCQKGIEYLLGKLFNQFTPEKIYYFCSLTPNPNSCQTSVTNTDLSINKKI